MKSKAFVLVFLLSALSGWLSALIANHDLFFREHFFSGFSVIITGLPFGIALVVLFKIILRNRISVWASISILVSSVIGYVVAYGVISNIAIWPVLFVSGALGSLILGFPIYIAFKDFFHAWKYRVVVAVGSLLGGAFNLFEDPFLVPFIIWQVGVAIMLVWAVSGTLVTAGPAGTGIGTVQQAGRKTELFLKIFAIAGMLGFAYFVMFKPFYTEFTREGKMVAAEREACSISLIGQKYQHQTLGYLILDPVVSLMDTISASEDSPYVDEPYNSSGHHVAWSWQREPEVFDADCEKMDIRDLYLGESITVYAPPSDQMDVRVIQRESRDTYPEEKRVGAELDRLN